MDGRPNRRIKAAFSNLSGAVWTRPKESASCAYLLFTEFEVTDRFFSPSIFGPSAKRAGEESKGEKRGSVTYSTDREDEVSKIIITSLLCV